MVHIRGDIYLSVYHNNKFLEYLGKSQNYTNEMLLVIVNEWKEKVKG